MAKAMLFAVLIALAAAASCPCQCSGTQAPGDPASVGKSLVRLLNALAGGDGGDHAARALGWNASVDPCVVDGAAWRGVICDSSQQVNQIILNDLRGLLDVNGTVEAPAPALRVLNLRGNGLRGVLPDSIAGYAGLARLSLRGNRLSGVLPASLSQVRSHRTLDVSRNNFAGELPAGLKELDKLVAFLANDNRFSGDIPDFDLTKFAAFNVSGNSLTGPIPQRTGRFGADSFLPNAPGLCGQPLIAPCGR